jgi:hypothetical protein
MAFSEWQQRASANATESLEPPWLVPNATRAKLQLGWSVPPHGKNFHLGFIPPISITVGTSNLLRSSRPLSVLRPGRGRANRQIHTAAYKQQGKGKAIDFRGHEF